MSLADVVGPGLCAAALRVRAGWPIEVARVLPSAFAEMLAVAIALEFEDVAALPSVSPADLARVAAARARAAQLHRHYLEIMPAQRQAQLAAGGLLQMPLDWHELPRLSAIIDRMYAVLADAGVAGEDGLGFPSASEFRAASPTLAAIYERTYYGGFMPLLYGAPADLAHATRQLASSGPMQVIDRCLAVPILHELSHLGRRRAAILPIHMDECIAGWLGVHVFSELAYPAAGEDNALYATPWFAQIGQALARVVGVAPLVRAHAGVVPWADVIPARILDGALRLGWQDHLARRPPHFLSDAFHPGPWLDLILDGAVALPENEFDAAILADGLRAMCLRNHQVALSFRVAQRVPTAIEIDLHGSLTGRASITAPPGADGWDPVPLAYFFPPSVARRLQGMGIAGFSVEVADLGAIPEVVSVIMKGQPWHASSCSIRLHPSR